MAESNMAIDPNLLSVRSAVRHESSHLPQQLLIDRRAIQVDYADDAAHSFVQNRRRGAKRPVISKLSPIIFPCVSIQAWLFKAAASLETPISSSAASPRAFNNQKRRRERTRQGPPGRVARAA